MMRSLLGLTLLIGTAQSSFGQLPQTRLYSLFPPGIAPGGVSEVRINTGADLDDVQQLIIDHPGVFATAKQQADGNGGWTAVANTFRVMVEADVPPGEYEVRAIGRFGISNPRTLIIDPRPAIAEIEPNNSVEQAHAIEVGTLVDGQVNGAGDLDYVRFSARKDERIIIDCLAARIDSKLNPILTLMDADGRPLAFARNEYGRDAFLAFDVPADGDYLIELRDETFSGGGEHLYRLQVHRGPHIRYVMPPAGPAGTTAKFALYGYNLPGGSRVEQVADGVALERLEVDIALPATPPLTTGVSSIAAGLDLFTYRYESAAGASNEVHIGLAGAPVALEQEPNDDPSTSQEIAVPSETAGQLSDPQDIDRFQFTAVKDQEVWIEVISQRAGAIVDPQLTIEQITLAAQGAEQVKSLASPDDVGTNLAANIFDTATDDPAYKLKIPETGSYRLTLRNLASGNQVDPTRLYRLIVRSPQPGFRLVAIPAGQPQGLTWPVSPRRGDHFALDVLAFRNDGFEGAIEVRPVDLPIGVSTQGTVIGPKKSTATLVLSTADSAPAGATPLSLTGTAIRSTEQGEEIIEQPVRMGNAVWSRNGNTPAISELETQLTVAVTDKLAPYQLTRTADPIVAYQGRQLLIPMTLTRRSFDEQLTFKFDGEAKAAKIDAPDVVFEKGETQKICRLFVQPDAPAGEWVLGGTAQAQVPYVRNALQAELAASRNVIAARQVRLTKELENALSQRVHAQSALVQQAVETLAQVQANEKAAREGVAQAQQAVATAKQSRDALIKQIAALTEEVQQLTTSLNAANEAAAASEDEAVKAEPATIKATLDAKQAELKTAQDAQTKSEQQLSEAETALKPLEQALTAAQQATVQSDAAKVAAESLKAQLDAKLNAAVEKAKAAESKWVAAEKAATDAANAAKPANVQVNQPLPPLFITIKPAPVGLAASVAKNEIKAGESVDVTVTVKRQNEFTGPVQLTLALPEGTPGLSVGTVDVPADADTGVVTLASTAETPAGDISNLVVRATMGEVVVDAPVAIKVTK